MGYLVICYCWYLWVLSTGMYAIALASQLCGETHIYGFGNGSCPSQCYHYYDCGEVAGNQGVDQAKMFGNDPRVTGGYHNFSAQAVVLRRLAASGAVRAHWGSCTPGQANPPPEYVNHKKRPRGKRKGRRNRGGAV